MLEGGGGRRGRGAKHEERAWLKGKEREETWGT